MMTVGARSYERGGTASILCHTDRLACGLHTGAQPAPRSSPPVPSSVVSRTARTVHSSPPSGAFRGRAAQLAARPGFYAAAESDPC